MNDSTQEIDTMAITLHEFYASYIRAGFSPDQAFRIILTQVSQQSRNGGDPE